MATTSEGRERTEMSLPQGVRGRIDELQQRMAREAEAAGEDTSPFRDRGVMVAWLVETVERVLEQRSEIESAIVEAEAQDRSLAERDEEVQRRERDIEEREQEIRVEQLRLQRQEGLSAWLLELFADLEAQGLDRMHVIQLAQVMRDSGLDPERVAAALQAENVGGLLGYAGKIREALQDAQREYSDLLEQCSALRQAVATLEAEQGVVLQAIDGARQEIQSAQHSANLANLRAQEVGIYVDWLQSIGVRRIEELPLETARIAAGTIILAAVGTHGDHMLRIPPGPTMLLGGELLLSDLPYVLAPKEAYQEMQQAHERQRRLIDGHVQGRETGQAT